MPLVFLLSLFKLTSAQGDQVTRLNFNPSLYGQTQKFQHPAYSAKYLISKGNTVVTTDTLILPFIDDFSTNREPSTLYIQQHTFDSFSNVIGGCLIYEGVNTVTGNFMTTPTWLYSWDAIHHRVDSTVQQPIAFQDFGTNTSGCLSTSPTTRLYWPAYYTYDFDTTGQILDSTLFIGSGSDTVSVLNYAPVVYYATGEHGTLWFDNYAYINNTYPINPPTIGVATLDGLDEFGKPYSNIPGSYGTADYLTSNPIDLSALSGADSVYFSFFFEPQGNGDYPDYIDSLILEFKDNSSTWRVAWSDTGYLDPTAVPDTFRQVILSVADTLPNPYTYYHNTFQFRFRNKASIYGNNNHWHIDYVKMDKNRNNADTVVHDMAFVYPFPTILKNFSEMPAVQFNGASDLADNIILIVHNLDAIALNDSPATNLAQEADQTYPAQAIVSTQQLQTFNSGYVHTLSAFPVANYTIPAPSSDSISITSRVYINPNDSRPQNDTLYHTQRFGNVMAYDDGTAEKAYGLTGLDLKKFGYEFVMNKPDTLVGFQVMFTTVEADVHDLVFNFEAWDTLRFNDVTFLDTPIITITNQTPFYIDSLNGFATYRLDTPIIVNKKIYFGWAQDDERRLQIGYDMNDTLGHPHMFIYTQGTWKQSTVSPIGSPMIRLIFDSSFVGKTSLEAGVHDIPANNETLSIFPNPTTGELNLRSDNNSSFDVYVADALGQTVIHAALVTDRLNIDALPNGIYLLTARDLQTGKMYRNKIIKSTF